MINRIFVLVAAAVLAGPALAQTPIPAYEGCTLAWEYPAEHADLVQSFGIHIEGKEGSTAAPGAARSIPCASIPAEYGIQTWKIQAWNKVLGHSPFLPLLVDYRPKPTMLAPTSASIILEWKITE